MGSLGETLYGARGSVRSVLEKSKNTGENGGVPLPVIRDGEKATYPSWSEVSHYGVNHLAVGDEVELHYHDCNEYWIIVSGRGICTTEGDTYELGPGDLVLTKKGDEHSLVVTEEMVAIYFYGIMEEGARAGHLHREIEISEGNTV